MSNILTNTMPAPGSYWVQDNTDIPYGQLLIDSADGAVAIIRNTDPKHPATPKAYADAYLLAAAPDLFAALEAIIPDLQHELPNIAKRMNPDNAAAVVDELEAKLTAARAAIAKARPGRK